MLIINAILSLAQGLVKLRSDQAPAHPEEFRAGVLQQLKLQSAGEAGLVNEEGVFVISGLRTERGGQTVKFFMGEVIGKRMTERLIYAADEVSVIGVRSDQSGMAVEENVNHAVADEAHFGAVPETAAFFLLKAAFGFLALQIEILSEIIGSDRFFGQFVPVVDAVGKEGERTFAANGGGSDVRASLVDFKEEEGFGQDIFPLFRDAAQGGDRALRVDAPDRAKLKMAAGGESAVLNQHDGGTLGQKDISFADGRTFQKVRLDFRDRVMRAGPRFFMGGKNAGGLAVHNGDVQFASAEMKHGHSPFRQSAAGWGNILFWKAP